MSYKEEFASNNADLQALLDKANALPVAVDTSDANASSADILSGKTAYIGAGKVTGRMPNNGAWTKTGIKAGVGYPIPEGYHDGTGRVAAATLTSQTSATAAAGDIRSGKTAWVNGSKVTGTLVPAQVVNGTFTGGVDTPTFPSLIGKKNFIIARTGQYTNDRESEIICLVYLNGAFVGGATSQDNDTGIGWWASPQFNVNTGAITFVYGGFMYGETFHYVGW